MPPTSYYIYSWSDTIPASESTAATLHQSKDSAQNDVVTQHLHQQILSQSQLNGTSDSILNNQQSLQREIISMMNEMSKRHEMNSSFMTVKCSMERTWILVNGCLNRESIQFNW